MIVEIGLITQLKDFYDGSFGIFQSFTVEATLTDILCHERHSAARTLYVSIGVAPAARAGKCTDNHAVL